MNERENNIDKILTQLVESGSNISYLQELKEQSLEMVKKILDYLMS